MSEAIQRIKNIAAEAAIRAVNDKYGPLPVEDQELLHAKHMLKVANDALTRASVHLEALEDATRTAKHFFAEALKLKNEAEQRVYLREMELGIPEKEEGDDL